MEEHVRAAVDAAWETRLGVERSVLRRGGVQVVVAGLGANDAMNFLLDETTRFWILREDDRVVAAGNMTGWRGRPADVGVLTEPSQRGRGLACRLVGAMVADALPAVGLVRYRALASNVASLAVAKRLGFERYGQNLRARRPADM